MTWTPEDDRRSKGLLRRLNPEGELSPIQRPHYVILSLDGPSDPMVNDHGVTEVEAYTPEKVNPIVAAVEKTLTLGNLNIPPDHIHSFSLAAMTKQYPGITDLRQLAIPFEALSGRWHTDNVILIVDLHDFPTGTATLKGGEQDWLREQMRLVEGLNARVQIIGLPPDVSDSDSVADRQKARWNVDHLIPADDWSIDLMLPLILTQIISLSSSDETPQF